MYQHLLRRHQDIICQIVDILKNDSGTMALDPRFYSSIEQSPSSPTSTYMSGGGGSHQHYQHQQQQYQHPGFSSPSAAKSSAVVGSPSAAGLPSSASSPSLRSRESVVVPMERENGAASAGGGNVRVVVRVRGFLPRGMLLFHMLYVVMVPVYDADNGGSG